MNTYLRFTKLLGVKKDFQRISWRLDLRRMSCKKITDNRLQLILGINKEEFSLFHTLLEKIEENRDFWKQRHQRWFKDTNTSTAKHVAKCNESSYKITRQRIQIFWFLVHIPSRNFYKSTLFHHSCVLLC